MDDNECPHCRGCGKVTEDAVEGEQVPWADIMDLPLKSSLPVLLGMVKPIVCPVCGGTGKVED